MTQYPVRQCPVCKTTMSVLRNTVENIISYFCESCGTETDQDGNVDYDLAQHLNMENFRRTSACFHCGRLIYDNQGRVCNKHPYRRFDRQDRNVWTHTCDNFLDFNFGDELINYSIVEDNE